MGRRAPFGVVSVPSGVSLRAARPELGPRASGSRQVPRADRRHAATTQVRRTLKSMRVPPALSLCCPVSLCSNPAQQQQQHSSSSSGSGDSGSGSGSGSRASAARAFPSRPGPGPGVAPTRGLRPLRVGDGCGASWRARRELRSRRRAARRALSALGGTAGLTVAVHASLLPLCSTVTSKLVYCCNTVKSEARPASQAPGPLVKIQFYQILGIPS